jgi:fumarate reductase flavoprotein subunit
MKRIFSGLLAGAMVASSLTACGSAKPAETTAAATTAAAAAAESGAYTPGTYEATEQGFAGEVKVTITTDEKSITDVKIEGASETPDKGGKAIEALQPELLKAQSSNVDSVAGATITSDAVKKAFDKAVAQAKGEGSATTMLSLHSQPELMRVRVLDAMVQ